MFTRRNLFSMFGLGSVAFLSLDKVNISKTKKLETNIHIPLALWGLLKVDYSIHQTYHFHYKVPLKYYDSQLKEEYLTFPINPHRIDKQVISETRVEVKKGNFMYIIVTKVVEK